MGAGGGIQTGAPTGWCAPTVGRWPHTCNHSSLQYVWQSHIVSVSQSTRQQQNGRIDDEVVKVNACQSNGQLVKGSVGQSKALSVKGLMDRHVPPSCNPTAVVHTRQQQATRHPQSNCLPKKKHNSMHNNTGACPRRLHVQGQKCHTTPLWCVCVCVCQVKHTNHNHVCDGVYTGVLCKNVHGMSGRGNKKETYKYHT